MKRLHKCLHEKREASFPCDPGEHETAGDCGGEIWGRRVLGLVGRVRWRELCKVREDKMFSLRGFLSLSQEFIHHLIIVMIIFITTIIIFYYYQGCTSPASGIGTDAVVEK